MILNPQMTSAMNSQSVMAPDGRCKTFDARADGYARAEAVVAIHIKKLSDAIQDNDPIRAVIRSTCINADGRTASMSQPNSASHAELIRRSHRLAGITDFCRTAMIECHGTGTQVGDPVEASAIASVFHEKGILIGSVSWPKMLHFRRLANCACHRSNPTLATLKEPRESPVSLR
jgi:acyl transferase domain-containing protein